MSAYRDDLNASLHRIKSLECELENERILREVTEAELEELKNPKPKKSARSTSVKHISTKVCTFIVISCGLFAGISAGTLVSIWGDGVWAGILTGISAGVFSSVLALVVIDLIVHFVNKKYMGTDKQSELNKLD